jgi:histidine ammonia-lyase
MVDLLNADCVPECPRQGSVGYLSHNAHIGLALIGEGFVRFDGQRLAARDALSRLGLEPLVLRAKEGLSLVNGTACATGLASLALDQARRLMDWADAVSAMSFEILGGQASGIDVAAMNLRKSPGLAAVTRRLNDLLAGSGLLASAAGTRTQDALSLRSIPQVHGAARDVWTQIEGVISQELASVTDNPAVTGAPEAPGVFSQAHAVGAAVGLAMDQIGVTLAQLGMIAERRIDRLVNPLVSGLPPFLAGDNGVQSGFMIAQYTAASLVAENRRLAAPASLDGGVTSGLQEDMLCHATPAALKALDILANVRVILAIEYLAAAQAYDLTQAVSRAAPATAALHRALRGSIGVYGDERPLGDDIAAVAALIDARTPTEILTGVAAPDRWVA